MLHSPIEPFSQGWLDVGHGHRVYYEQSGNPSGTPVLFMHGGPGSSTNPGHRRFFDPVRYRVVLFDQRGCGRSTPLGAVEHNTTTDLVADVEALRGALAVERWVLFGGSWGSALAMAYARTHVSRVAGLVLRGVFLATRAELEWFLTGPRRFLPEAWQAFSRGEGDPQRLLAQYCREAEGADQAAARAAARAWTGWESALMAVGEAPGSGSAVDDEMALARVRVQLHYLAHECFLAAEPLVDSVPKLAYLPCIVVQGRRDLVCPPVTAYTLVEGWPRAQLRMIEEGGHSASHPAMTAALVQATHDIRIALADASA